MATIDNGKHKTIQDSVSEWQQIANSKHPLLSQLGLNIIAGIIAGVIIMWWAANNIPPKPKIKVIPTSSSSAEIKIENFGYIPAYNVYEIASGPVVKPATFSIKSGKEYIKLEDADQEHIKYAIVEGLPKSRVIQINISGSSDITINNK